MTAPLAGIRVVEAANWLAAPSAAAMMRDLGADVIKVEPPEGDAWRHNVLGLDVEHNYAFELDNRGKRSIALALDKPGGPELLRRLVATADIFITNLVQPRRERFGLTAEELRAADPGLIYVSFSGYGTSGAGRRPARLRLHGLLGPLRHLGADGRCLRSAGHAARRPGRPHDGAQPARRHAGRPAAEGADGRRADGGGHAPAHRHLDDRRGRVGGVGDEAAARALRLSPHAESDHQRL